jgi:hypothetical protein
VGLFNIRSCYIIVYFVLRSAYEAWLCCEQTPIQTMNVMVFIGLLTTTVSSGTCMNIILNSSSPEKSWTLRWDEMWKPSTTTLIASTGCK